MIFLMAAALTVWVFSIKYVIALLLLFVIVAISSSIIEEEINGD